MTNARSKMLQTPNPLPSNITKNVTKTTLGGIKTMFIQEAETNI